MNEKNNLFSSAELKGFDELLSAGGKIQKLASALKRSVFSLYAQRLIPLAPYTYLRRYEVLLRLQAAGSPNAAPAAMLKAASENGLSAVIDQRITSLLSEWLGRHPQVWSNERASFSVNLAISTAQQDSFVDFVRSTLGATSVPASILGFELDVHTIPDSGRSIYEVAEALERVGCTLALDNFQLGAEGIDLLHLPGVKLIKLDPAAMVNVRDRSVRESISSVCDMAKGLGVQTGVKGAQATENQRLLTALGIDFLQCHRLGAPAPIESLL
jgi:EAL domain-containing protein (putative c-di-GMP-specific phosphodiesterase class I)